MDPHPRIRKTIKWGCAAATVLLVAVWLVSAKVSMGHSTLDCRYHVKLHTGQLHITHEVLSHPTNLCWEDWWSPRQVSSLRWGMESWNMPPSWYRAYPLWPLPLLTGAITLGAWFGPRIGLIARHRTRMGRCPKCSYDRAGLAAEAKCPECGATAQDSN